ncbi:BET1 homolog [Diaphorina citri]|uniref:BET1 homolog n=1 Tax=Diaphorina citri TaxID=121845 RepID=A0A1S3DT01_DIACI|nr:BET1 homolog [Diaphorina citri]XP_008488059.1 BET1 homolog [Diaphorina citri]XP_008488060.1 BET1 homolog [Diaphorina citri]KAI5737895.1 hypothetical protein M8J77_000466 [Diaphorina citri]
MDNRMRRQHAGNYYEPVPNQFDGGDAIHQENEQLTSDLRNKIQALKSLTIDIGTEVKYQNEHLLRGMDDDFDRTGGFLNNSMARVLRLTRGGHNYYILYLFLFSIFVFFLLYFVIKFK